MVVRLRGKRNRRNRRALGIREISGVFDDSPCVPVSASLSGSLLTVVFSRPVAVLGHPSSWSGCNGSFGFLGVSVVSGGVSVVVNVDIDPGELCLAAEVDFNNLGGWKDDLGRVIGSFFDFPLSV